MIVKGIDYYLKESVEINKLLQIDGSIEFLYKMQIDGRCEVKQTRKDYSRYFPDDSPNTRVLEKFNYKKDIDHLYKKDGKKLQYLQTADYQNKRKELNKALAEYIHIRHQEIIHQIHENDNVQKAYNNYERARFSLYILMQTGFGECMLSQHNLAQKHEIVLRNLLQYSLAESNQDGSVEKMTAFGLTQKIMRPPENTTIKDFLSNISELTERPLPQILQYEIKRNSCDNSIPGQADINQAIENSPYYH